MPYTQVDGTKINYELKGRETGRPVVFLHGLGSSGRDWELQIPAFEGEYRIVLIDMRGHGKSDKPPGPYSVAQFATDTVAVLDHLGIKSADFVGLSMGGMIAFQLAVDYPERVRSMVIANSGPALVPQTLKQRFAVWMRFFIVRAMGMRKMGETLAPRLFTDAAQELERQTFIERWAENDRRAYLDAMRALIGWSVEERISAIKAPTLILASEQDYTPVSAKAAYVAKMSTARLKVIENAHHAVAVERPEAFNSTVLEFLRAGA